MPARVLKITKAVVERTAGPNSGQAFIRDNELTGFAVRLTAGGAKSFVWEGRVKGRMRRITLGQYPGLTVVVARQRALEVKVAVARGQDPTLDRERDRRELTFGDLVEIYVERHARPRKKSWNRDVQMIDGYVAKWRTRRLSDLSREDVARLHHDLGRNHGHYAANRTLALLRAMFNLASDWGYLRADNPTLRIKMFPEEKRERFLSPDELSHVNDALTQEPNVYWRAYFPLCLLLGPRRGELLAARWTDVDLEQRTWRLPTTKAGRSHLLPLPEAAVAILESLPSRAQSDFIFPGAGATGHLVEPKKAWQRIRERAGVPDVRIHDLRRTLGSWLAAQGYSLPLIGRALNHSNVSTTQVYARLDLGPVREALEKNATLMMGSLAER